MMRTKRTPGFAIATLLLFIPIILMMVWALFSHLKSSTQWSGSKYGSTASQYVAEAGAAHAVQQLKAAPDWVAGFTDQPMAGGKGSYTVDFNQTKAGFQPHHSVNNFDGDHADSPLGPGTVPSGAALVAVEGKVGAHTTLSYFLIGTGDDTIRVEQAILTSGKIQMEGETKLTAVESMAEKGTLDAEVHSNDNSSGNGLITWDPGTNGGNLLIEGEVSSSGSSSGAVDLNGETPTNGITTGAAQETIPPAGIETRVFGKRSATAYPGSGSVPSGDNYYDATSTPLTVSGDLVLNGDLYVEGDLQVTGSIRGNGSVYVSGETRLFGDSKIDANDKVALFSHGSVSLTGFDGDVYLDGIAASDPSFATLLNDSRTALQRIENDMLSGSWVGFNNSQVGFDMTTLAPNANWTDYTSWVPGLEGATLHRMKLALASQPPGPARDFMVDKLTTTTNLFANNMLLSQTDQQAKDAFYNSGTTDGIIDAANDMNDPQLMLAAFNTVRQINYDRLGSSYFQGLIYTNGGFYADNQVTVLGAVVVNDDGSQSPFTAPSGDTVNPGDLILKGGSNITYVKDFFFGPNAGGTPGPRRVLLHLGNG